MDGRLQGHKVARLRGYTVTRLSGYKVEVTSSSLVVGTKRNPLRNDGGFLLAIFIIIYLKIPNWGIKNGG